MIKERINQCFNNLGILLDPHEENFLIEDYIQDSVTFVSFIAELELEFSIEIPDSYLSAGNLKTYADLITMVENQLKV